MQSRYIEFTEPGVVQVKAESLDPNDLAPRDRYWGRGLRLAVTRGRRVYDARRAAILGD